MRSEELLITLLDAGVKADKQSPLWWPNPLTFEVVLGAILVQNTNWKNVDRALKNLNDTGNCDLEKIVNLSVENLALIIKQSGFYNTKAKRLKTLCDAIYKEFGDFENFKENASREWLLKVKGIGEETCDAILCYACGRDEMVVDSYALRVLRYLGYEFQSYEEAKEWLGDIDTNAVCKAYGKDMSMNEIFARYHGKIVEFCKESFKGERISERAETILSRLK